MCVIISLLDLKLQPAEILSPSVIVLRKKKIWIGETLMTSKKNEKQSLISVILVCTRLKGLILCLKKIIIIIIMS